ncbi:hypothetical protein SAHL_06550 [Salinisphaera orenii YIM 95161]|uniref:Uncharacterized protein n=1 Tax=Salinisphaera orenii YIM 95161 TaxID=1051139 RepID=A0A423Q0E5_9GAMM|nr:hypothetical protein SAHL_06550 [Salinisphaera halophila YIM 95161]
MTAVAKRASAALAATDMPAAEPMATTPRAQGDSCLAFLLFEATHPRRASAAR